MIITVTMNPAIDKTVYVSKLKIGAFNRLKQAEIDAGGKGSICIELKRHGHTHVFHKRWQFQPGLLVLTGRKHLT